MKKYLKLVLIAGILVIFVLARKPAHHWSRQHVNYITAVDDHPLNCMAVSPDGSKLYVIAQEGNALLVIDTQTNTVTDKIAVGENPHSVILKNDGNTAFVSNQWADNVYKIDLSLSKVVDTLKTGSGSSIYRQKRN